MSIFRSCLRQSVSGNVLDRRNLLRREFVHMALLLTIVAGTAALLAMDAGCYLLLRANDARRCSTIRRPARRHHLKAGFA
jgi:hypothetical protein